jgi:secreted protein with Ig-like and vWFA domain
MKEGAMRHPFHSSASNSLSASKHRRQAAACGLFAANAQSAVDRELLLRMQRSLLTHARHEDWFDGGPPLPPARAVALAVPARK